ncbi:hypothetical protein L1987_05192 [Smallanthus sonchifolius]|uniref:Uncharacterized protein n=1 Tax=Smallanthus sonchifolius TaxID=185202 RepID=A0ACB9JUP0_9ASTR|nr:hypothetical protein L1987_05192 [Smallanthus sonchifolius]
MKYYEKQCESISVENTVREIVWSKVVANSAMAAKLLRLHYHDCFVRGCDGSILLDPVQNVTTEKTAGPSRSVTGYDVIDDIKTALEASCPRIVSCADIVALAARDAVSYQFQKEMWPVFTGRKDGNISLATEVGVNLPSANANFTTVLAQFETKGLEIDDVVTLSGAHTIGISHCSLVSRRLYNFTGVGDADPSLDPTYAQTLREICPIPVNATTVLEMDPNSSLSFDSQYFEALNQHKGLFVSDAALLANAQSAQIAQVLQKPEVFFARFARSMVRMGAIEVVTDDQGQVRENCRLPVHKEAQRFYKQANGRDFSWFSPSFKFLFSSDTQFHTIQASAAERNRRQRYRQLRLRQIQYGISKHRPPQLNSLNSLICSIVRLRRYCNSLPPSSPSAPVLPPPFLLHLVPDFHPKNLRSIRI